MNSCLQLSTIPAGFVQDCVTGFSREVVAKIEQRDTLRSADPTDPEISNLNCEISSEVAGASGGILLKRRIIVWTLRSSSGWFAP
jgi:hypothetical protein